MLRRVLLPACLAAIGLAGAVSAALLTPHARAQEVPGTTTTAPATTTTTTTTAVVSGATTTTATTTTVPATTTLAATTTLPATTSTAATTTTKAATTTTKLVTTTVATTTAATVTTTGPVPSTTTASGAPTTLVITGHGWGHGVGMSQWGTYGFAKNGWSYQRILVHYYRGTTLGRKPSPTVRVLLVDGAKRVTLASEAPWTATDARGTRVELPAGRLPVAADLALGGKILVSPVTLDPGATPLSVAGKPYRGKVLLHLKDGRLQVVNALALEDYVKGVVGHEVPSSWPAEALKVQAVAARTYALAGLTNIVTARIYDLYNDTRSQVYGGIEAEVPSVTKAVAATSRQVVLYRGKVATTYYSSTSGGRTTSAAEEWGTAIPYLVSVPDPYDNLSPHHDWGPVLFDARKVAKALKLNGALTGIALTRNASDRVQELRALGSASEVSVGGSTVRAVLGLRSSWFSVGWLSLAPPPKVAYGRAATLTGVRRDVGPVQLEGRPLRGEWETVAEVAPDGDGAFSVAVKPKATMQYRLVAGDVRGALVTLAVEPVVKAAVASGAVKGTMRPALPGAAVQLQRQQGASWATVATATTDTGGAFALATPLAPGSYRIRCAPGRGLSPGVSALLAVS